VQRNSFEIRRVPVTDVIPLRHTILRAGLPIETASFDGDNEPTTTHFAAYHGQAIVGCATVLRRPWESRPAWQVRGMAVIAQHRRGGVGRALLDAVERHVIEQSPTFMWCNARSPAVGFYKRLGWRIASEEFEIATAGPHFKMTREL
jgi:GNAT superfamily N-acetyltransferase